LNRLQMTFSAGSDAFSASPGSVRDGHGGKHA
jgi:hypothetical protein